MLADAPQTPPGLPPGSAPTQSPYGPPGFDSAAHTARPLLDPGVFDVSGLTGPGQNGGPLPAAHPIPAPPPQRAGALGQEILSHLPLAVSISPN